MSMTQGVEGTWSREEIPLAQLRQQGIWSRCEEIADKRRDKNSELKKTRMAILGLRTTSFIQVEAGFKAQRESVSNVQTLVQLLIV